MDGTLPISFLLAPIDTFGPSLAIFSSYLSPSVRPARVRRQLPIMKPSHCREAKNPPATSGSASNESVSTYGNNGVVEVVEVE